MNSVLRSCAGWRGPEVRERARERVLTDDELRAIWAAASEARGPFGDYVQFPLTDRHTPQRSCEGSDVLKSPGSEWTNPGTQIQNRQGSRRPPLPGGPSGTCQASCSGFFFLGGGGGGGGGGKGEGFLFSTTGGEKPITAFWKFKEDF